MSKIPTLCTFIDLGASLIKVMYQSDDQLKVLLLPPNVATISERRLNDLVSASPNASPEDLCWLEVEDQLIAIGNLAIGLASPSFKQRKIEQGLDRVLAVLGILQETLTLPESFECHLWVALPVAEYADRETFAEQLRTAASSFSCRGRALQANFRTLDVQVEGMGLVRDRRATLMSQKKTPGKIVALMFGHRNLSVLVFSGSALQLESCSSSGPGFVKAVEVAARALSIEPTADGLIEVVALGKNSYRFEGDLRPRQTAQVVKEARQEYWNLVASYLQDRLPGGEFEIVAAGGALATIKEPLQQFFDEVGLGDALSFAESRQEAMVETFSYLGMDVNSALCLRLLDAFVGMQALLAVVKKSKRASPAASAPFSDDVVNRMKAVL